MKLNAFVPLKGHSARVPGKNMRPFAGAPLFHTIVRTLQQAERVERIYVDTDDDEIAASAEALDGVTVLRRNPDLVGDEVSMNLLIGDFLANHPDEHLLQTHSTNPLLTAATVDDAVGRYFADVAATSLFAVTRIQARLYFGDLTPVNHDPSELIPTQDLPPVYLENSNFYVFSRAGFLEGCARITSRALLYEMDPVEAVDIDEEHDFRMAELLYEARRQEG